MREMSFNSSKREVPEKERAYLSKEKVGNYDELTGFNSARMPYHISQ